MSTIFDVHSLRLPRLPRRVVIVLAFATVLGLVGATALTAFGLHWYRRLTTTTVVAYFSQTLALYPGDRVEIMGVRVGKIDAIEPDGDKMRVTLHYASKYPVPADASAAVLNPSLVASRTIQLTPPYEGGPTLRNGDVIPIGRTQVPVEWDELRDSLGVMLTDLGPTPEQPRGPFGAVAESAADNLAGRGKQIHDTLEQLSEALTTLKEGRGDFAAITRSLALFVNALRANDRQFVELNDNLAEATDWFTKSDTDVSDLIGRVDTVLNRTRKFLADNGSALSDTIGGLAEATTTLLQPEPMDGLETALHVLPNFGSNINNIYHPVHGSLTGLVVFPNFANPLQMICSSIQAASRLGYQDSAELCAQYLTPILDAMKFNYVPFAMNFISTASTLPKQVAYSEERLRPPPGYKDTTVPGVFSRDTPFSHRNSEPGWIVAPGMQGLEVQELTARMLTPDSLAALLGGPDPTPPPPGATMSGPPNAYDETRPPAPGGFPQHPPRGGR